LTVKKAQARKKQRLKKKTPRKNLELTKVEAEIMFVIWKGKMASLTYAEIAERHAAYFGGSKKKDATVRGIIFDIRLLEKATDRKYLQPYGGKPGKFKIDAKSFIDLQWTALILLEFLKGYPHKEYQIPRDEFEQYLLDKYDFDESLWSKGFISGRLEYLQRSQYISFFKMGSERQYIGAEARLEHDQHYLILIVEDYYREWHQEDPLSPITQHLEDLIALYRPTQAKGGNA
jgi:hypothetical protein